jgi:hypothetical protein
MMAVFVLDALFFRQAEGVKISVWSIIVSIGLRSVIVFGSLRTIIFSRFLRVKKKRVMSFADLLILIAMGTLVFACLMVTV